MKKFDLLSLILINSQMHLINWKFNFNSNAISLIYYDYDLILKPWSDLHENNFF